MKNKLRSIVMTAIFIHVVAVGVCSEVTFDWVTVGDPGFGGVDYSYRISKHEVTNTQYTEFLNAVQPFSTSGLYDSRTVSYTHLTLPTKA